MATMLKEGSRGDDVTRLQESLRKLGYDVSVDGIFGKDTDFAVRTLQQSFGYSVDGLVGPGTLQLIEQQIGYGWNAKLPDAQERAKQAQGKA
jgi:peptidoglycan hydrolase-like protein with peptidoglycan-binding domain